jgi:hypothetical protein
MGNKRINARRELYQINARRELHQINARRELHHIRLRLSSLMPPMKQEMPWRRYQRTESRNSEFIQT